MLQTIFYFPLRNRLKKLLSLPSYRACCEYEFERQRAKKNENIISDVYDSDAWKSFMGPPVQPNNRLGESFQLQLQQTKLQNSECTWIATNKILLVVVVVLTGFQLCMDGIPAFSSKTKSLKPLDLSCLSLAPALRQLAKYILLMALFPDDLHEGQKKYFDFFAEYELNDMFHHGIHGVKIKIFATSMDTPGRAELLGMESCASYTSCCVCTHCFSPGIGTAKKLIFDGYRRFLNIGSRGRRRRVLYDGESYEYHQVCDRPKPRMRDDEFVRAAVAFAKQRGNPFMGHKSVPLLSKLPGFSWYRINTPDVMHGT